MPSTRSGARSLVLASFIVCAITLTFAQLVTTVSVNSRLALQSKALATVRSYEKEALESIRRMSLIAADLEVKGPRKFPGSSLNLGQSGDGQLSLAGMA